MNDNQVSLLICAGFFFLLYVVFIDSFGVLCCFTGIALLVFIPALATQDEQNTYNFTPKPDTSFTEELNQSIKNAKKAKIEKNELVPNEWEQLKQVYPEAALDEYKDGETGKWDINGLIEDLKLMVERTGKKPKEEMSKENNQSLDFASMTIRSLKKILKEEGLPITGGKAKLIERIKNFQMSTEKRVDTNENKKDKKTEKNISTEKSKGNSNEDSEVENKIKSQDKFSKISELNEMLSKNLINKEEFKQLKDEILGDD